MRKVEQDGFEFRISEELDLSQLLQHLKRDDTTRSIIIRDESKGSWIIVPLSIGNSFRVLTQHGKKVTEVGLLDGDMSDKMGVTILSDLKASQSAARSLAAKQRVISNKEFTAEAKKRIDAFFATIPDSQSMVCRRIMQKLDANTVTNQLEIVVGIEEKCQIDSSKWAEIFTWFGTHVLCEGKSVSEAPSFQMLRRAFISTAVKFFSSKSSKSTSNSLDKIKEQDTFDWSTYANKE